MALINYFLLHITGFLEPCGLPRSVTGDMPPAEQHQGPFLRRCRHRLMGRANPPLLPHGNSTTFSSTLFKLFFRRNRGFETFDGGNKGLGGGRGKPGKKWNACLSCLLLPAVGQQDWGWVGLSAKRRAGNAMYTLLRCLLQSKEALFVSYFWNLLSLGISWPGQLWQPLAI